MSIPRYYTVGAIAPDVGSFKGLVDRLEVLDLAPDSVYLREERGNAQCVLSGPVCLESISQHGDAGRKPLA